MTWFTANVTLTNGQQKVDWNSGDPLSKLSAGDGLIVNGGTPLEVISIGSVDFMLKTAWPNSTVTTSVTAVPLPADFIDATEKLRSVSVFGSSLFGQMADFAAAETSYVTVTDAAGVDYSVPTPKVITDTIAGLGTAATKDVTTSATDTTANRLLKTGDFGLGTTNGDNFTGDVNTLTTTGFYIVNGGSTNQPQSGSAYYLMVTGADGTGFASQIAQKKTSGIAELWCRTSNGGTWTNWVEIYHSGNSVNSLDYGLGHTTGLIGQPAGITSANELVSTGWYRADNLTDIPTGTGAIQHIQRFDTASAQRAMQLAFCRQAGDGEESFIYQRSNINGVWKNWVLLYDANNTNFNVFGGLAASDVIAVGSAIDATTIRFYLPINSNTAPSGITLSNTGDFDVFQHASIVQSSVNPAISGISSNKILVVSVSGLTGLTVGSTFTLRTNKATSKITVNF